MLHPGDLIANRWQAVRLIGTGGFSRVWEAVDITLKGRTVAVKEMAAPRVGTEEARRVQALFHREIEVLSGLSHPGLPAVYDGFVDGERWCIVLELVPGTPLDAWREHNAPSTEQVVTWGAEIADILEYLHGRSEPLVVRDLKPSNLIVGPEGRLRLVDLGIAAILRPRGAASVTLSGMGTPGYAAPEQYGRGDVDPRADLYALGATLYFLLAGEPPPDAVDRILGRQEMRPLLALRPQTPPPLTRCIERGLLALEPLQRPATAAAARDWLRRSLEPAAESEGVTVEPSAGPTLGRHMGRVLAAAWIGTGRLLTAGPDDGVMLWDADEARPLALWRPPTGRVTALAWTAEARLAAIGGPDLGVLLWDPFGEAPPRPLADVPSGVTALAFTPDGRTLAAGLWDKTIGTWDVASGLRRQLLSGHAAAVSAVAYSPDGRLLASTSSDRTLRLWSPSQGTCVQVVEAHPAPVHALCFLGSASRVATGGRDRTIAVWNASDNVLVHRVRGHADTVTALCVLRAGAVLASASWDGTVRLWDTASGAPLGVLDLEGDAVSALAADAAGRTLAVGTRSGAVRLFRV